MHRRSVNVSPVPHFSSEEIKGLRLDLNLSQKTFAEVMGVSVKSIEAWESGRSTPNGAAQRMLSIIKSDYSVLEKYHLLKIV